MVVIQKIKIETENDLEKAKKYFQILSILNNLNVTEMEANLLAFLATKGSVSSGRNQDLFCEIFNSTKSSIRQSIGRLKKKGLVVKVDKKLRVLPQLSLNFTNTVVLQLTLNEKTRE